jgi:signal peptidase I
MMGRFMSEHNAADGGGPVNAANESERAAGPPPARRHRRRRVLIEWAVTLGAALLLAAGLHAFVLQAFHIPSPSMVPALEVGDRVLVQKAFFSWHDLHEGDIVVFTHPPLDVHCGGPAESDLVKRVIALPGQTIYSSGNHVYVDGRRLSEPYLPRTDPLGRPIPGATEQSPFHVPPGEFYVMGDDRQISCDSRYWGPVRGTSIVGKVVLLWWHDGHPDLHPF